MYKFYRLQKQTLHQEELSWEGPKLFFFDRSERGVGYIFKGCSKDGVLQIILQAQLR